jgi:serine O-acetyltransferase
MIQSKEDFEYYLEADRIALLRNTLKPRLFQDEIWRFELFLRKVEYLKNVRNGFIDQLTNLPTKRSYQKLGILLGYYIPPNTFGPGLSIAHRGTIVVHPEAKIGKNCRIHHNVTIGDSVSQSNLNAVPKLGDNIFIGTGAVIVGDIQIADGICIGANSYVNRSFTETNITIAGCPAEKVSNNGSGLHWIRATDILEKRGRFGYPLK